MFQGNLRGYGKRFDIIEGIRVEFSEKVTFKWRLAEQELAKWVESGVFHEMEQHVRKLRHKGAWGSFKN